MKWTAMLMVLALLVAGAMAEDKGGPMALVREDSPEAQGKAFARIIYVQGALEGTSQGIESWIFDKAREMNLKGINTDKHWIELKSASQPIFGKPADERFAEASVSADAAGFIVKLTGKKIVPADITLAPAERRLAKLTDDGQVLLALKILPATVTSAPQIAEGLQVRSTIGKRYQFDEPLSFSVEFSNVTQDQSNFTILEPDIRQWKIVFKKPGEESGWEMQIAPREQLATPVAKRISLQPGTPFISEVDMAMVKAKFQWNGPQKKPMAPRDNLPAGVWEMTIDMNLPVLQQRRANAPAWSGEIATRPVKFEIAQQNP